jgi:hypothetical protein
MICRAMMRRFRWGANGGQNTLFPECLEDWIGEDNPVRVIDVFVDELDLAELGLGGEAEIRRGCRSSTSTGISTACSRAAGLSVRLDATLS